ncbi:hypothetical protein K2173_001748 [Erythroxylum novogranatense]|uniref:Uncharacterized protein n=1 Tax=Erythroxylum novogranatense TaxID=1862640 RepID=A0AAV8S851_9ROSI|nr:hypothetical protein K2173_001748 [Erythroxylum novogranatense]
MSLRYMGKEFLQRGSQKTTYGVEVEASTNKLKGSISCPSSSSKQMTRFTGKEINTAAQIGESQKLKRAEESLRTVMYLSCWGPN